MSTTGPQDFPDFGRYSQAVSTVLVAPQTISFNGPKTFAVGYVGNLESIAVRAQATGSAQSGLVQVLFYNDSAMTQLVNERDLHLYPPLSAASVVPVVGSFCQIVASGDVYPGGQQLTIVAQGLTWMPPSSSLFAGKNLGVLQFSSVAPGGQPSAVLPSVCDGVWTSTLNSDSLGVRLRVQQGFGNPPAYYTIAGAENGGIAVVTVRHDADCVPTQVTVTNLSGGTANMVYAATFGD